LDAIEFKKSIQTSNVDISAGGATDAIDTAQITLELVTENWSLGARNPDGSLPKESRARVRLTINATRKIAVGGEVIGPWMQTFDVVSPKNGGPPGYFLSNQSGTRDVTSIVVTPMVYSDATEI
jgi:hypothetical protein